MVSESALAKATTVHLSRPQSGWRHDNLNGNVQRRKLRVERGCGLSERLIPAPLRAIDSRMPTLKVSILDETTHIIDVGGLHVAHMSSGWKRVETIKRGAGAWE